jgi:riboflavin synthase
MFTGLIEALGTVRAVHPDSAGRKLTIAVPFAADLAVGESVAVNGACLTVLRHDASMFEADAGPETLSRTNLGQLQPSDRVNLERSLRLNDRLGGHLVQGHIDGTARIQLRLREKDWELVWFESPASLCDYMVPKGSVAVDGVSLTLVDVERERFSVALIPHTLSMTTLGLRPVGASVNIETDLIGKYVAKLLRHDTP